MLLIRTGPGDEWCVGMRTEAAAAQARLSSSVITLQLYLRHGNDASAVHFSRTEEDMRTFLANPLSVAGSDGSAIPLDQGKLLPHPRGFGIFAKIPGRYVRQLRLLNLEEAVAEDGWRGRGATPDRRSRSGA